MDYLAKSVSPGEEPVTLYQHTLDVLQAGLAILDSLPLTPEEKQSLCRQLVPVWLCHDWGKVVQDFQKMLHTGGRTRQGFRHEIASDLIATCFVELTPAQRFVVLTHHKACFDDATSKTSTHFPIALLRAKPSDVTDDLWLDPKYGWLTDIQKQWLDLQHHLISPLRDTLKEHGWDHWVSWLSQPRTLQWVGFKSMLPYIALDRSDPPYSSYEERLAWAKLRGLTIAADHLGSAKKLDPLPSVESPAPDQFLPPDRTLYPYQAALLQRRATPHLLLRAPTGAGKTEALFCWLHTHWHPKQRVFYTLPFTASANAMHRRLCRAFGNHDAIGILHSKAASYLFSIMEEEPALPSVEADTSSVSEEDCLNSLRRQKANMAHSRVQLAREIFFPVKVCTPHQLLRYSMCGKGWEMGLLDLQHSSVIFDEFHTYDPKLAGLLLATARWLIRDLQANVAFISATIPSFLRELITQHLPEMGALVEPDPQQPRDAVLLHRKRHRLQLHSGTLLQPSTWDALVEAIDQNLRVLVVVNNVRTAQEVSLRLQGIPPSDWPFDHIARQTHVQKEDEYHDDSVESSSSSEGAPEHVAETDAHDMDVSEPSQAYPDDLLPDEIVLLHGAFNPRDRRRIEQEILSATPPRVLVATQAVEVSLDIDYDIAFIEAAPIDDLIQRFGRVNRAGLREPATIHLVRESIGKTPFYPRQRVEDTWKVLLPLVGVPLAENDLIQACDLVYKDGYQGQELEVFTKALHHPQIESFRHNATPGFHISWVDEIIEPSSLEILPGASPALREEYERLLQQSRWIEARELLVPISFSLLHRAGSSCHRHDRTEVFIHDAIDYCSSLGAYIPARALFDDRSF